MTPRKSEEGAALLSVLLLVAVMAVLCAASLEKLKISTKLATNGAAIDQARSYGMAAETIALYRIGDLLQRDTTKTTLQGNWAGQPTEFPINKGIATAQLDDGGNCFNLNSVVIDDGQGGYAVRPDGVTQFERLMILLQVPSNEARGIAMATADWIDTDGIPQPGGAEDAAYAGGPTPYRTANVLMIDPSELRAVAGVRAPVYAALRPFLCALPVTDLSPINVNTIAPRQAVLLAMLAPGIDVARAQRVIDDRPQLGFESLVRFWEQPALAGAPVAAMTQTQLKTRWFNLKVMIELAGAEFEQHALIDAALKPAKLVRRSYGEPS
jgi:general secretion pathway protein K